MSCCEFIQTLSVFVVSIQIIFGAFRWIYSNVIGPKFLEPVNLRQYGNWALVTGATDGIGKQYATSLAKRGLNVILVSRTLSKLEAVAKEISENFNVQTQVIAVDFTSGSEIYSQIKQQITGKDIGILINNVGMFYPAPDYFLNIPDREKVIQDIIRCNIASVPMMCSLILPQMVERKRGVIVNISSLLSVFPGPLATLYAASKAFVSKFSNDLAAEYESQGITIQVLVTGEVDKNISFVYATTMQEEGGTFSVPKANQYVESAISHIGHARYTSGFLPHSSLAIIGRLVAFVAPSLFERVMTKNMLAGREKAIKRGSYKP